MHRTPGSDLQHGKPMNSKFLSVPLAPKSHEGGAEQPRSMLHTQMRTPKCMEPPSFTMG